MMSLRLRFLIRYVLFPGKYFLGFLIFRRLISISATLCVLDKANETNLFNY